MTTKKANSRVMKSAYETSQRSWFTCSACFLRAISSRHRFLFLFYGLFPKLLVFFLQESHQFAFDEPRILTFKYSEHAFQHHFLEDHGLAMLVFEFGGGRKEKDIGGAYTVNRGDERDRDSFADLLDVVQVLHNLNESE